MFPQTPSVSRRAERPAASIAIDAHRPMADVLRGIGAILAVLLLGASTAGAQAPGVDLSLGAGPWVGTMVLDSHLGDYQWDTAARTIWGVASMARLGRLAGGVRAWRGSTEQSIGTPAAPQTVDVKLTGIEGVGEVRLARFLGARLLATGSVGVIRFRWDPETATLDAGGGAPVVVDFDPIQEGTAGLGIAVRRSVLGVVDAGLGVERTWFHLDTTHRRGNEIVTERERFGSWTARIELSKSFLNL